MYICNFLSCKQLISNEIHDLELMAMSVNIIIFTDIAINSKRHNTKTRHGS